MKSSSRIYNKNSAVLEWTNLEYKSISTNQSPSKTILKNISGIVRPGEFLAIMGPSGAGKTTLLNALSGKYQSNLVKVSGRVAINGRLIETLNYKAIIGFVPQDDILVQFMTTRECLDFSAKMTTNNNAKRRKELVDQVIEELELTGCADSIIGGQVVRGISGGEKKRVSIGVEMIFNPSVIFLDEPTTGLDSFTAAAIIGLMSRLASENNSTIISTIHQPSSRIFNVFDKVLLLSFGSGVYMGKAEKTVDFFSTIGYPVADNYNPSDHFMNVLSKEEFKNPDYRDSIILSLGYTPSTVDYQFEEPKAHYSCNMFLAFFYLLQRFFIESARNPLLLKGKLIKVIIGTILIYMTFYDLGSSTNDIGDRYGIFFMVTNGTIMEAINVTLATFQTQKAVFIREYFGRRYGVVPYLCSYVVAGMPVEMLYSVGQYLPTYYGVGLNPKPSAFFFLMGLSILAGSCGSAIGLFVSIISPSMEIASSVGPIFFTMLLVTSGMMVSLNNIPDWFFIQYLSPFRYTMEASIRNEFTDHSGISESVRNTGIDRYHIKESQVNCIFALVALAVGFRVLAVIAMKINYRNI